MPFEQSSTPDEQKRQAQDRNAAARTEAATTRTVTVDDSSASSSSAGRTKSNEDPRDRLREHAEDVRTGSREAGLAAREQARSTMHRVREAARDTNQAAIRRGRRMAARVRSQSEHIADEQKNRIAEQTGVVGEAIHDAAGRLREADDTRVAGIVDSLAGSIDHAADYLRDRRPRDLLGDVRTFARRHPELFVGGMFILGAAAARFLRASRPEHEHGMHTGHPSDEHDWRRGGQHGWETHSRRERPFAYAHAEGRTHPYSQESMTGAPGTPGRTRTEKVSTPSQSGQQPRGGLGLSTHKPEPHHGGEPEHSESGIERDTPSQSGSSPSGRTPGSLVEPTGGLGASGKSGTPASDTNRDPLNRESKHVGEEGRKPEPDRTIGSSQNTPGTSGTKHATERSAERTDRDEKRGS